MLIQTSKISLSLFLRTLLWPSKVPWALKAVSVCQSWVEGMVWYSFKALSALHEEANVTLFATKGCTPDTRQLFPFITPDMRQLSPLIKLRI